MSVAPISPVAAALLTDVAVPTQAALNAIVETAMAAETATLLELVAPGDAAPSQTKAVPANPVAQAVDAARTAAAVRQGGLAPLFADLAQAQASPALPAALKAAVSQVLALQLPADGPVTGEALQQAVGQSGLFLEAHLAAGPPNAPAPPLDLKAALLVLQRALVAVAAAGPPAAPASDAAPGPVDRLPPSAAPPANAPLTAGTVKQALAQAGRLLEAHLANPAAPANAPLPDLKAVQATLQRALTAAPTPDAPALPAALRAAVVQLVTQQLPPTGPFTPQTLRQAVAQASAFLEAYLTNAEPPPRDAPPELREALRVLQRALTDNPSETASPEPRAPVPPPPHRQAVPTAQPAARATLPANAEPAAIAQHLRGQVAQAVARQTLHQVASLPDGATPTWLFELPMATPQGTAVAQFAIDRDGEASGGDDPAATAWRARFSIDIEPLGPVHVHLRMEGDRTAVTVWAMRAESLEQLRGQGGELARALPAEVTFRGGAPPQPAQTSGRFVDQTS